MQATDLDTGITYSAGMFVWLQPITTVEVQVFWVYMHKNLFEVYELWCSGTALLLIH